MKGWLAAVTLLTPLLLLGCGQYELVDTQDKKVVDPKTCNCEVLSKDALKSLRDDAELSKQINRYQMRNEGFRTWRFDTATGRVCLLMTSESEWKKPDVERQACTHERESEAAFWDRAASK